MHGNFLDAAHVPAAFEGRVEELVHDFACRVARNVATGHHKHVGVVVHARHLGNFGHPYEGGAYVLVLVERHGDSFAAAADGDAAFHFARLHTLSEGVGKVGIVAAFGGVSAVVLVSNALFFEVLLDVVLEFIAGVVAGKSYHCFHNV